MSLTTLYLRRVCWHGEIWYLMRYLYGSKQITSSWVRHLSLLRSALYKFKRLLCVLVIFAWTPLFFCCSKIYCPLQIMSFTWQFPSIGHSATCQQVHFDICSCEFDATLMSFDGFWFLISETVVELKVAQVVNLKLAFTDWFLYNLVILNKLFKIRY